MARQCVSPPTHQSHDNYTDALQGKQLKRTIINFIKEFEVCKEDMNKELNELKKKSNKCLNHVQESTTIQLNEMKIVQNVKTEFSEKVEILTRPQSETEKFNSPTVKIKGRLYK